MSSNKTSYDDHGHQGAPAYDKGHGDKGYDEKGSSAKGHDNGGGAAPEESGADDIGLAIDTSPQVSFAVSDVLKFEGDDCGDCGPNLTIVDSAAVGVAAPTVVGVSIPSDPLGLGEGSGLL